MINNPITISIIRRAFALLLAPPRSIKTHAHHTPTLHRQWGEEKERTTTMGRRPVGTGPRREGGVGYVMRCVIGWSQRTHDGTDDERREGRTEWMGRCIG